MTSVISTILVSWKRSLCDYQRIYMYWFYS